MFFYGTLRHVPLLEVVAGCRADRLDLVPATLADHRVHWVEGEPFPMIVAAEGHVAEGLLMRDIGPEEERRLDLYEGGFEYALRPVEVTTAEGAEQARVYYPVADVLRPGATFSLADWEREHARAALKSAAEIMEAADRLTPEDVDRLWPAMKARAFARAGAEVAAPRPAPSGLTRDDIEVREVRRPYIGFFALEEWNYRRRNFEGGWSDWLDHAIFVATDAALVLPYDPVRDEVLLIEQARAALLARGDPAPWCLEPVAGRIDAGESPETCAQRELMEEAGLEARALERIGAGYASPGDSTEFFHFFIGLCDLSHVDSHGGLDEEHEDIRSHVMPFDAALRLADEDRLPAAPLVLMLNWLARHRDRLRQSA